MKEWKVQHYTIRCAFERFSKQIGKVGVIYFVYLSAYGCLSTNVQRKPNVLNSGVVIILDQLKAINRVHTVFSDKIQIYLNHNSSNKITLILLNIFNS